MWQNTNFGCLRVALDEVEVLGWHFIKFEVLEWHGANFPFITSPNTLILEYNTIRSRIFA
jgi:hypothetical protein